MCANAPRAETPWEPPTRELVLIPPIPALRFDKVEGSPAGGDVAPSRAYFNGEVTAVQRLLGSSFAENAELRKQIDRLQAELQTRELVEQAEGIIMGRLDIGPDEARAVLTVGAGPDDTKLRIVAAAVVAARRTPAEIAETLVPETPQDDAPLDF